jgi:hypothetical protein
MNAPVSTSSPDPEGGAAAETKASWAIGTETQDVHRITMLEPRSRTCNRQCPWRAENYGKSGPLEYDHEVPGIPMPEDFNFATWKRADIWKNDLCHGEPGYGGLCHVRLAGTKLTERGTWNIVSHQCTGALVMQQRELLRYVAHGKNSTLTDRGAARIASDMLGRKITENELAQLDSRELAAAAHPALLDAAIGCDAVAAPFTAEECATWTYLGARAPELPPNT